eukprot:3678138-Rhodomonas_salina.2
MRSTPACGARGPRRRGRGGGGARRPACSSGPTPAPAAPTWSLAPAPAPAHPPTSHVSARRVRQSVASRASSTAPRRARWRRVCALDRRAAKLRVKRLEMVGGCGARRGAGVWGAREAGHLDALLQRADLA